MAKVVPGASRAESPAEYCMVMIWKDLDSPKARTIGHYEVVEA